MHFGQIGFWQTRQRWLMNWPACFRHGSRGAPGVVPSPVEREAPTSLPSCRDAAVASPPPVAASAGAGADRMLMRTGPERVAAGASTSGDGTAADAGLGANVTGGAAA